MTLSQYVRLCMCYRFVFQWKYIFRSECINFFWDWVNPEELKTLWKKYILSNLSIWFHVNVQCMHLYFNAKSIATFNADFFYFLCLYFVSFAFCHPCILVHLHFLHLFFVILYFVSFELCCNYISAHLYVVKFLFCCIFEKVRSFLEISALNTDFWRISAKFSDKPQIL